MSGDSAHAMRIRRLSCESDMFSRPRVGSMRRRRGGLGDPLGTPSPTRATDNSNDCDHSALGAASDAALSGAASIPPFAAAGTGTGSFAVR